MLIALRQNTSWVHGVLPTDHADEIKYLSNRITEKGREKRTYSEVKAKTSYNIVMRILK